MKILVKNSKLQPHGSFKPEDTIKSAQKIEAEIIENMSDLFKSLNTTEVGITDSFCVCR